VKSSFLIVSPGKFNTSGDVLLDLAEAKEIADSDYKVKVIMDKSDTNTDERISRNKNYKYATDRRDASTTFFVIGDNDRYVISQ